MGDAALHEFESIPEFFCKIGLLNADVHLTIDQILNIVLHERDKKAAPEGTAMQLLFVDGIL